MNVASFLKPVSFLNILQEEDIAAFNQTRLSSPTDLIDLKILIK